MKRSSREFRNHAIRRLYTRAASGFATPDEQELAELNIPPELRDEVRATASKLHDVARSGDYRGKQHARTMAEVKAEEHIEAIPPEYADAIRPARDDDGFTAADAADVGQRIHSGDSHRTTSESIDERIRRRGRSTLDRLGS